MHQLPLNIASHIPSLSRPLAPLPLLAQPPTALSIHTDAPPSSPPSSFLVFSSRSPPWHPNFDFHFSTLSSRRSGCQVSEALARQWAPALPHCGRAWLVRRSRQREWRHHGHIVMKSGGSVRGDLSGRFRLERSFGDTEVQGDRGLGSDGWSVFGGALLSFFIAGFAGKCHCWAAFDLNLNHICMRSGAQPRCLVVCTSRRSLGSLLGLVSCGSFETNNALYPPRNKSRPA